MKRFFLGIHQVNWFVEMHVPVFVSHSRLRTIKNKLPKANAPWALDSCGFTELSTHGKWTITEDTYIQAVRRYQKGIGALEFASIQDWMCEPFIIEKTGKTVREHQELTVASLLSLRKKAPDVPWLPVLQGFEFYEYMGHIEMYKEAGIDLSKEKIVGVGSVCRRQGTEEATDIIKSIYQEGIAIHAFGFKVNGLMDIDEYIVSSDSMAWSLNARKNPRMPFCNSHKSCANCHHYALKWREKLLDKLERKRALF